MHIFLRSIISVVMVGHVLAAAEQPSFIFITADDLNYDSVGVFGGAISDLTPNIDQLAASGLRFNHSFSTVAVCLPVRASMHTGLYPHRNGTVGFVPIHDRCTTLNERLHEAGYLIAMIGGKHDHYRPLEKYCVDISYRGIGRYPSRLRNAVGKITTQAKSKKVPFFLQINCNDPHRPFIGADGPDDMALGAKPSRFISVDEVTQVPGFLEDIPDVRKELAQYYTNVRRLDDCVGAVLDAVTAAGLKDEVIVVFYGGDHGMAFPYSKSNNYYDSARGGLIVRWPGVTTPGSVDNQHMVSTIDFTPTLLDAAGLPAIPNIDGRSFLPAIRGEHTEGWDAVYTFYNQTFGKKWFPMRGVITKDYIYVWNAWSDGREKYFSDGMSGLTWKAMQRAAEESSEIKERVDFFLYRTPEEFYSLKNDSSGRNNLMDKDACTGELERLRALLLKELRRSGDPLADAFAMLGDSVVLEDGLARLRDVLPKKAKALKIDRFE